MYLRRFILLYVCMVLVLSYQTIAQQVDFLLNENNRSYRTALTHESELRYMNLYMARCSQTVDLLFKTWANSYALIGTQMPLLGKPHISKAVGLSVGIGNDVLDAEENVGLRLFDGGSGSIPNFSFFLTLASDKIPFLSNQRYWSNTDITFQANSFQLVGFEDVRLNLFSIGIFARKQIVSEKPLLWNYVKFTGVTLCLGTQYAALSGREDDIGNGFYNDIGTSEPPEVVLVDKQTGGTVSMGAPISGDIESMVHYPYVDFHYFAIQSQIKGYMNVLYFLDVFAGAGLSILPYNNFYGDVSSDVNMRISDNQGLDTNYDGRMTVIDSENGRIFIPYIQFGVQCNFGPVKLPVQICVNNPPDNRSINAALYVSF